PIGLHVNLPLQTEAVEIIDQRAAHECLDSLIEPVQRDLLGQGLSVIDLHADLGNAKEGRGQQAGYFRTLARFGHEQLRVLGEEVDPAAGAVLENKSSSTRGSYSRNRGRRERERNPGGHLRERLLQVLLNSVIARLRRLAHIPGL